jgi:flagellar hook-basal body complex protein FliE
MSAILPIQSLPLLAPHLPEASVIRAPPALGGAEVPFADLLASAIASANGTQQVATNAAQAFAAGAGDDIHGTMIAVKEADIELKLVANVRNKLLEAFNDLWRLSV